MFGNKTFSPINNNLYVCSKVSSHKHLQFKVGTYLLIIIIYATKGFVDKTHIIWYLTLKRTQFP